MSLLYRIQSTTRIVMVTANLVAVLVLFINCYTKAEFDTISIMVMVILALNVLMALVFKPKPNPNGNPEGTGQAPDPGQDQA